MTREKRRKEVAAHGELAAEERLRDALVGDKASVETRQKFRKMLREGELDGREIEIELKDGGAGGMPMFEIPGRPGAQMGMANLQDMLGKAFGGPRGKPRKVHVGEAMKALAPEEKDRTSGRAGK